MAAVTPAQRQRRRIAALLTPGLAWITLVYVVPGTLIVVYSLLTPKLGGGIVWELSTEAWNEITSKGRRSEADWGTFASAAVRTAVATAIAGLVLVPSARRLRRSTRGALFAAIVLGVLAGANHLAGAYNNYSAVFARSVLWSLWATATCVALALPLAVFISSRRSRITKNALLVAVMIPFWTSMLVRTFAIRFTLSNTGPLNNAIESMGLDRQVFLNTRFAVILGLVYTALPFMVLPLYAAIERADRAQLEAARDLGARPPQVFLDVFVPLIRPGLSVGSTMVFVLSVSQYLVPTLLGGGKNNMIANLLDLQFGEAFNWPLGAAVATLFSLITIGSLYFVVGRRDGADLL